MEEYNATNEATLDIYILLNAPRHEILFISSCLLLITVAKTFLHYVGSKLPLRALLLIGGMFAGYMARGNDNFATYVTVSSLDLNYFLTIFFPIYIFNSVFKINQAVFYKNKWQTAVLAIPSILINTSVIACVMKASLFSSWYWTTTFMYGIICSPIDSQEVINLLHESAVTRYIKTFLQGETFFGEVFSIYLMKCLLCKQVEYHPNIESFNLCCQWLVGGIIFGYIVGAIASFTIVHSTHTLTAISITISALYLTAYTTTQFINVSGDVSVALLAMTIAKNQFKMETKIRKEMSQFWNVLSFISSSLLLVIASCAMAKYTIFNVDTKDISTVFLTLILILAIRCLTVLLCCPLLSRMNGGFTIRQASVVMLSSARSNLSIALSMLLVQYGTIDGKSSIISIHAYLLLLITLIIVGGLSPYVLQYLKLREPPLSKRHHVTNCLKRLEKMRDKSISAMKMQSHMTDVNWNLIEQGTSIEHPYNVSIEDCQEAEDDDFYLAFLNTYCPRCQYRSPRPVSDNILTAMRREAKCRILEAKRISYRKQYQNGLLSLESLMALLHMIDEAELSTDLLLKTDWIDSIWKPRSSTMNIRQRLIAVMLQDEPEPLWPNRSCRQMCYVIASSSTFSLFMYCAIILNSILIVTDITMPAHRSQSINLSFQLAHFLFYLLLLLELIIKISGLSFDGYLNSKWNQLEFIVFAMASFDEFLMVLGLIFLLDAGELLVSSSWLRCVRLIRLLKLGRVLAPKLVTTIDSRLEGRMLAAFEIGKGFITGEREVLSILGHLIDDPTVYLEIRKEIEEDCIEACKQMLSLQKNRPWLATSVRTRHMWKHVLLSMKNSVQQMKTEGWLEKSEYKRISLMVEEKYHIMERSSKYTRHSSGKILLRSIYWLTGDEESFAYLQRRSRPSFLCAGQTVLHPGQICGSVHVILSGVLVAITADGVESNFVSGDCIGLREFLTGETVHSSVITLTNAQLCTLSGEHLRSCILATGSSSNGLESRMWCYAARSVVAEVMRQRPGYKDQTLREIHMMLERGFVPGFETFKAFEITDIIEHIILIHGEIMDQTTKRIFKSPYYIPRNVRFLALPNINDAYSHNMYPKLLILPAEDADEYEIQERDDGITIVVGTTACRCLRHRACSGLAATHTSSSVLMIPPRRKVRGFRRPMVRQSARSELISLIRTDADACEPLATLITELESVNSQTQVIGESEVHVPENEEPGEILLPKDKC